MMLRDPLTIASLLQKGRERLQVAGIDNAHREAQLLLIAASGLTRERMIADDSGFLDGSTVASYSSMLERRIAREPVGRIVGGRVFYGLDLVLSRQVLEPRDDTGTLVDLVLETIGKREETLIFADIGTGSGAIALALLAYLPNAYCVATDISGDALETATINAKRLEFEDRFSVRHGSWLEPFSVSRDRFDFIVSNPPYIPSGAIAELQPEVRNHDPQLALDGGVDGLAAYRTLVEDVGPYLKHDGFLAIEIGYDQDRAVAALAEAAGWCVEARRRDLAGCDRVMCLRRINAKETAS